MLEATVTQSSGGGGHFLHAMIVVDAGSGAVPGALGARFMEPAEGGKASRRSRSFEGRQSLRWLVAPRSRVSGWRRGWPAPVKPQAAPLTPRDAAARMGGP